MSLAGRAQALADTEEGEGEADRRVPILDDSILGVYSYMYVFYYIHIYIYSMHYQMK